MIFGGWEGGHVDRMVYLLINGPQHALTECFTVFDNRNWPVSEDCGWTYGNGG